MVVLDVGAFLGYYTLVAAERCGPSGKVFAFEPDPRNFAYLLRNVKENGFTDRVATLRTAAADRSGTKPFFLDTGDRSQSSLAFRRLWGRRIEVDCVRLDEWLASGPAPDVIKMDIEGGELLALNGMEETIRRSGSPITLFIEYYPAALRAAGGSGTQLLARLAHLGFDVKQIDEEGRMLSRVDPRIRRGRTTNLYCVRPHAR